MNSNINEPISSSKRNIWQAWILLILGLAATTAAAVYVKAANETDAKRDFDFACNEIRLKIERRLNAHAQILRSGAAFFDASDSVTREKWHTFTMRQKVAQQLPGIQGLGFALLIPREQLARHIREIRDQGFPEYTVKPEGQRDIYSSIIYLEPFSGRNLRAFAYDMLTEPVRRAAMERARDTDSPTLSGKVTLVQETDKDIQAGTLMYVPVYRKGIPTDTVENRRSALCGWVYSPYRMNDLMEGILGGWDLKNDKRIRLQIFDEQFSPDNLLYDSQPNIDQKSDFSSMFILNTTITSAGRGWILRFARTGIQISDYTQVWLVIFSGVIISLLLFALAMTLFNTRIKARQIAEQLTVDLRESEERYRKSELFALSILDALSAHIAILDEKGTIIKVNRAWRAFAQANSTIASDLCEGSNYIAVCETSVGRYSEEAKAVAAGIRSIILDEQKEFMLEYPCHSSDEKRWFNLRMTRFESEGGIWVVSTHENISDGKLAEEALRESEENFRAFFDTIDHLLFVLDNTGNMIRVNHTVTSRLGFTEAELLGKNVLMVHPEEHREEAGRIVSAMLEGKRDHCPIPLRCKDGNYIPAETRIVRGKWSGQDVLFGVSKDISDIKASEERFSKAFYNNPSAMAITDLQSRHFTDINNAFIRITGYEREEIIGKTALELGLFEDIRQRDSAVKMIAEQGHLRHYEMNIRRKSGEIRCGLFSGEVLNLQSRKLLLTMMDDITERKQAEKYLKLNEARLETLLRISQYRTDNAKNLMDYALSQAIRMTDSSIGYIYYYNEAAKKFTLNTWSQDVMSECRITNPQTLYHLDKTGLWGEAVRQRRPIIINDFQAPNPLKKGYPEGHAALYNFLTVPVIIEGCIKAVIGVANKSSDYEESDARQLILLMDSVWNIADRKKSDEELKKAKEAAESANRAKSEFLASMSHELRTPLTGVISLSEALLDEVYGDLNEKQRKTIASIENSGQHLLDLITDILDLSKIEAGQMELQIGKTSVGDICQSALQLTKGMANKKRHNVSFRMNPVSVSIEADPRRLKQMLVNLLSNAVKFTPEGGQIGLEVIGDEAGQVMRFAVSDTGIGIAAEMFPKLFRPFVQLDSRLSRQYSGTGLGLSLVQRMTELHGGSVGLESEVGEGSRFTISLPWKPSPLPEKPENKIPDKGSDQHPEQENRSEALILLVEDNEINISLYSDYLQSRGFRVAMARNGKEGVEKAAELQPDLILMDIQMPEMDGLEATCVLRADANDRIASTPIIALTSLAMPGDKEKCLASGANDYLSKPVSLGELVKTIEKYLNK